MKLILDLFDIKGNMPSERGFRIVEKFYNFLFSFNEL